MRRKHRCIIGPDQLEDRKLLSLAAGAALSPLPLNTHAAVVTTVTPAPGLLTGGHAPVATQTNSLMAAAVGSFLSEKTALPDASGAAAGGPRAAAATALTSTPYRVVFGWYLINPVEQKTFDLINQERQKAGLLPLEVDFRLMSAAQRHSYEMARLNQLGHVLPGEPTPPQRLARADYSYSDYGEIIYSKGLSNFERVVLQSLDVSTPKDVARRLGVSTKTVEQIVENQASKAMDWWMNSPEHRAIILSPNFTEIGVGVVTSSKNNLYSCVVFGRPR